jgi:fucose 4-O-acetylase-like acetyltransferase
MKKLASLTALASGVLLVLVPRFILPPCEYEGYPAMHCSDTARAEYLVGALLVLVGGTAFFAKTAKLSLTGAAAALILYAAAYLLPDSIGYCRSPRMPCNYGMVPAVRFISAVGAVTMIIACSGIVNSVRTKGKA